MSRNGLIIEKGARHCKILDEDGNIVFRTTNLRDAEHYLQLVEEVDRLHRMLAARGVAPHRIYLLAADEAKRGRVNLDKAAAHEVVIVAKAEDAVVVRNLSNGHEEIVDLDELEPIPGGSYLLADEAADESIHIHVRVDREEETASVIACRTKELSDAVTRDWSKTEESIDREYSASLTHSEGDVFLFSAEVSIDE